MTKGPKDLFEIETSSRYRVFELSRVDCMLESKIEISQT